MDAIAWPAPFDYRALFERSPQPIVVFDAETRALVAVNDAACHHFGYERAELLGRDVSTLRPESEIERMRAAYRQARAEPEYYGPTPFGGTWKQQRKDGSIVEAEIWRMRVEHEGRPAVMAFIRDVTERVRAEAALREAEAKWRSLLERAERTETALRASEQRFRAVIENVSEVIMIVDEAGEISYVSPSVKRVLGWDPEQLLATSALEKVHPDDRKWVAERLATALATPGAVVESRHRGLHADGSWRWLESVGSNLLHVPSVGGVVASFHDVTDRIHAERTLRESQERYRLLFDATPLPTWVADAETGRFLAVNEAMVLKYGWSRDELLGMTAFDIRPPEDVERLRQRFTSPEGKLAAQGVWKHRKRDGTTFDVEVTLHALQFGGRTARLVVASDVTERRRVDEQLRLSQKMEATGLLAGGIAHDFNNLLGVILGSLDLVRHAAQTGGDIHAHLGDIDEAARRAADLTRKLLAFSRKQLLRVRPLDLGEALDDFVSLLRRVVGEDVELQVRRAPERLVVSADPSQIEQVLLNLCTNARQAMREGGRLVIETKHTTIHEEDLEREPWAGAGEWAEVSVADTGEGMDEATIARALEPFFTTKESGTGLGLSMVHGIVAQHRGLLHVESERGRGTTVRVLLPIVDAPAEKRTERPARGGTVRGGRETLLLAEDEPALRKLAARALTQLGYEVIVAADGEEAVQAFEANRARIALAILDVVMPKMGGVQAYERMRAMNPALKVVFTTGYAPDAAGVAEIAEREGHAILIKPFPANALGARVRETLDGIR